MDEDEFEDDEEDMEEEDEEEEGEEGGNGEEAVADEACGSLLSSFSCALCSSKAALPRHQVSVSSSDALIRSSVLCSLNLPQLLGLINVCRVGA